MSRVCKNVFLLFLTSFLGVVLNPEIMTASDSIKINDLNQSNLVETIIPEPPKEVVEERVVPVIKSTYVEPKVYLPDNYIKIGGRTIEVVGVDSTLAEAGQHVNYIGKLLYGHNSGKVFGHLAGLGIGATFTVVYNDITTVYQITDKKEYMKNMETGKLQDLDGTGNYMTKIKNNALGHDLALMTCSGEMLSGGDATHRLVVFADKI